MEDLERKDSNGRKQRGNCMLQVTAAIALLLSAAAAPR